MVWSEVWKHSHKSRKRKVEKTTKIKRATTPKRSQPLFVFPPRMLAKVEEEDEGLVADKMQKRRPSCKGGRKRENCPTTRIRNMNAKNQDGGRIDSIRLIGNSGWIPQYDTPVCVLGKGPVTATWTARTGNMRRTMSATLRAATTNQRPSSSLESETILSDSRVNSYADVFDFTAPFLAM